MIFGLSHLLLIFAVVLVLPIIALIDILKNDFQGNNKLQWVLVVILLPVIGSLLYFFFGMKQKMRNPA